MFFWSYVLKATPDSRLPNVPSEPLAARWSSGASFSIRMNSSTCVQSSSRLYKHRQYIFGMISMYFTSGQIDEGGVESERAGGRTIMGRF